MKVELAIIFHITVQHAWNEPGMDKWERDVLIGKCPFFQNVLYPEVPLYARNYKRPPLYNSHARSIVPRVTVYAHCSDIQWESN